MTVEVIFSGFAARYIRECEWHPEQKITEIGENKVRFSVVTGSLAEIKRWILGFGQEAESGKTGKVETGNY